MSGTFASWLMGGFEGSSFRFHDGRRVDAIAATAHDARAAEDYQLLNSLGIRTARDAFRWHLIETAPGRYDWTSVEQQLDAAAEHGVQVIWDLCHFGVPGHVDPMSPDFIERFADFAAAAGALVATRSGAVPWWCPVNEISYWCYASGAIGYMEPVVTGRGDELKWQLVRASLAAIGRLRDVDPRARFLHVDPLVHVVGWGDAAWTAHEQRESGFAAWDMISGRHVPELGGAPEHLDVIGVNYYPRNQRHVHGDVIPMGECGYRPLRLLLQDVWDRYHRPIVIAETGAEAPNGPGWMRYVAGELRAAIGMGIPVHGLCMYPVMDYVGWVDGRPCQCGAIRICAEGHRRLDPEMTAALEDEHRVMNEQARRQLVAA